MHPDPTSRPIRPVTGLSSVKYQPGNHSTIRPPFLNHYYSGKVLALRSQMTQKKQSEKKKLQRRMMQVRMPLQTLSTQGIIRQSRSSLTHANGNLSIRTKKIMIHLRPKLRMTSRTRYGQVTCHKSQSSKS